MRVLARFMMSAMDAGHFPAPVLPEVAFLGRSNVGKSSVINSLLGAKLAKTSSTPGRTRSINFFELRWAGKPQPELIFTDLPGYGYAKVSREISAQWPTFIEPYLLHRPVLALVFGPGGCQRASTGERPAVAGISSGEWTAIFDCWHEK